MSLELARTLIKELSKWYDEVAVLVFEYDSAMVKLWNSEPSVVQSWIEWEVSARLAKAGRLLSISLRTRNPSEVVAHASELAKYAERVEPSELYAPLPEPSKCTPIQGAYDSLVEKYLEDPSPLAELLATSALKQGVDRVAGTVHLGRVTRTLATSKGFECVESKTFVEAYARAFKGEFSGHWAYGSTRVDLDQVKLVGEKAGTYAQITKNRVSITPGKYRVAISPLVVGNLFNYVARAASALSVLMGFSFFAKFKPGDKLAPDWFSLYDKPRDIELQGCGGFDDEGVETADKPIIGSGTFRTLLHNTATATKMQAKSTGNAGWVSPRPWNVEVSRGELREEELVQEVRNGLIITNNWYTRLQNYYEGYFSTVSRDAVLVVQNGEVVGDAGRVRIATNFPQLLMSIEAATRTPYNIAWWEVPIPTRAPYVLLREVNITKPEV